MNEVGEREKLDLSFRVKITLSADASIRSAGGFTRTRQLLGFQKMNFNTEIIRSAGGFTRSATRTRHLGKRSEKVRA